MPRSAIKAMTDAVPDHLMSELRADSRKRNPVTESGANPPSQPQRATPNWIDERPLEPPPGIKHVDALVSAQDAKDRAERELALAKIALAKKWKG